MNITPEYSEAYRTAVDDALTILGALYDQREAELHIALETGKGALEAQAKVDACADMLINIPRVRSARVSNVSQGKQC